MMSDKPHKPIVVRFVLDLQAEDASYVDIEFANVKQAKRAITDVLSANGALVEITAKDEIPLLLRSSDVSAAFPIEYDSEED